VQMGLCSLSGDPHIKTFDRVRKDRHFYSYGDYWVVKREDIWVQARYWSTRKDGNSAVRILAISEPRVNGKVGPVLIVNADQTGKGQNANKNWAAAPYSHVAAGSRHSFEFTFSPETELTVDIANGLLNVILEMPRLVSGQSGHCGNFNANAADDVLDTRMVDNKDLLLAPHPTQWGTPSVAQCSDAVKQMALHVCTAMYAAARDNEQVDIAACVVDYCGAGLDVAKMGLALDLELKHGKKGQKIDVKTLVVPDHDQHDGKKGKKGTDHDHHDGKKGKKGTDHDHHDGKKGKKGTLSPRPVPRPRPVPVPRPRPVPVPRPRPVPVRRPRPVPVPMPNKGKKGKKGSL